jgi:hypothetical protein
VELTHFKAKQKLLALQSLFRLSLFFTKELATSCEVTSSHFSPSVIVSAIIQMDAKSASSFTVFKELVFQCARMSYFSSKKSSKKPLKLDFIRQCIHYAYFGLYCDTVAHKEPCCGRPCIYPLNSLESTQKYDPSAIGA